MKASKLLHFHFSLNNLTLFLLIMTINIPKNISQDFQCLTPKFLTNETSLMDLNNYEDENIIITKKEIFKGINPQKKGEFTEEFPQNVAFVTYNSNYLLVACTNNAILSFININELREVPIYTYEESGLDLKNNNCSISFLGPYAYVTYVTKTTQVFVNEIRLKIKLDSSNLIYEEKSSFTHVIDACQPEDFGYLSCEAIQTSDLSHSSLLCGHSQYFKDSLLYRYYIIPTNFYTNSFDAPKVFY